MWKKRWLGWITEESYSCNRSRSVNNGTQSVCTREGRCEQQQEDKDNTHVAKATMKKETKNKM